ncbi:hypothetical protein D5045_12535 [Verminephrobacter eiseniae]|nr:hypothetical protein [Verminephrobacter eiseniae]
MRAEIGQAAWDDRIPPSIASQAVEVLMLCCSDAMALAAHARRLALPAGAGGAHALTGLRDR